MILSPDQQLYHWLDQYVSGPRNYHRLVRIEVQSQDGGLTRLQDEAAYNPYLVTGHPGLYNNVPNSYFYFLYV